MILNHNVDIQSLRSFILADKFGSFSKAAENLNCSQAALSFRIKKLEQRLGTRLFHRNYHALQLTTSGHRLLSEALNVVRAHDQLINKAQQIEVQEVVRLGVPEELTRPLFNDVMAHYQGHDALDIALTMLMCRDLIQLVEEDQLDMAMATVPPETYGGELLCTRELLWVASPNYKFDPDKPIPLALHPQRCIYRDLILGIFETSGIDYRVQFSSQGSMSVQAAVAAGIGLTVITQGVVPPELIVAPTEWGLPNLGMIEIRLFKNARLSPLQLAFAQHLATAFSR